MTISHVMTLGYTNLDDGVWLNCSCGHNTNLGFSPTTAAVSNAQAEHLTSVGAAPAVDVVAAVDVAYRLSATPRDGSIVRDQRWFTSQAAACRRVETVCGIDAGVWADETDDAVSRVWNDVLYKVERVEVTVATQTPRFVRYVDTMLDEAVLFDVATGDIVYRQELGRDGTDDETQSLLDALDIDTVTVPAAELRFASKLSALTDGDAGRRRTEIALLEARLAILKAESKVPS
jgi:hypothetical protein